MKPLFKSNLSWFMLLYLLKILLTNAMDENKPKINIYSVNQLQNDFIGLKKNPQKFVEFQLNAEKTAHPDAGGLYELLPYYQKINPLGEKANYAIQWCDFERKYQLIKINPLGDLRRLDVEETNIATLLEGDQFSRPINADIKAYTTYEQMKSVVKTVGEKNKELKIKIMEMEETIVRLQSKINDEITSAREANKKLEETFIKIKEQNKKLKAYALEQNNIANKVNEQNKIQGEENQKMHEDLENLTSNLKEKEIQITKKNEEKLALEYQKGDLAYKLSDAKEYEHKFLSLEKEAKVLKSQIKYDQEKIKQWNETSKQWELETGALQIIFNRQLDEIQSLTQKLKSCNNQNKIKRDEKIQALTQELKLCNDENEMRKNTFKEYKNDKEMEMKLMQWNWEKDLESSRQEIQRDIETYGNAIDEKNDVKIQKLKEIYNAETKQLEKEIYRQQELLDQQTKIINIQENDIKTKGLALESLMNQLQNRPKYFVIDPQVIELENEDNASNSPLQTHNY